MGLLSLVGFAAIEVARLGLSSLLPWVSSWAGVWHSLFVWHSCSVCVRHRLWSFLIYRPGSSLRLSK